VPCAVVRWEPRAWTIRTAATVSQAGGVVRTDFERGFIKTEVVSYAEPVRRLRKLAGR
jgi:ribosome-binding ATPase YchF (GTP1/OBG family)